MSHLSSKEIVSKIKLLVTQERHITAEVISYLEIVQAQKIYAEWGYGSLFEFCVRELGYSESAAQRRISAMRLTCDVPEARLALETGALSLSTMSRVQSFSRQQNIKNPDAKRKLLEAVQGKSKIQTEKYLASIAPHPVSQEKQKVLTQNQTEIRFVADDELLALLQRVRELWAHKNPNFTHAELTRTLAQFALKAIDPEQKRPKQSVAPEKPTVKVRTKSRYIAADTRVKVWSRDQGKCQYYNPNTKIKCESRFGLEFDHVKAFRLGGSNNAENLRLYCRTHNLWRSQI